MALRILRKFLRKTPFYATYKRLGHYPDYWYWTLRGRPARPPHLVKQRLVKEVAREYNLQTLVETGTYYGEMVAATKEDFAQIYSIEFDPQLAAAATKRFRSYPHVHVLQGSSLEMVPQVLRLITQPALFWLDAGYFMWKGELQGSDRLNLELDAILSHSVTGHIVLIDDVVPFSGRDGTLDVGDLEARIKRQYPERVIWVDRGIFCIRHQAATPGKSQDG